jgi:dipeptidyl aminopeptidase/acylaminoacyl peptidase
MVLANVNQPGEITTCPTELDGEQDAVVHTDHNALLRKELQLGRTREIWYRSHDGTRVQGWLTLPPGFNPERRYPAILQIHGGPAAQYAFTFLHEMQFLAGRGYVVLYINPRGGTGRGETWAGAIEDGWGEIDYQDTMAAADWLQSQPFVNGKRMGICGGSYGGYMTNWVVGHTDRFRAAVTQRCVSNLETMFGTSDIGFTFDLEFPGYPWTNPELYRDRSPIYYCENVKTPLLIIHSEQDLRCPTEQAEQMFVKLKVLGKKVEMVRFPEESHGLSRHGRPDRRLARLAWIERWFDQYLKR